MNRSKKIMIAIIAAAILIVVIVIGVKLILSKEKKPSAPKPTAAAVAVAPAITKQKSVIWEKWKEVQLDGKWTEYMESPYQRERVAPPKSGKVEIQFEDGTYHELIDSGGDTRYNVIDVGNKDGKFRLRGISGSAAIWVVKG